MRLLLPLLFVLIACTCGRAQITQDSFQRSITLADNDSIRLRLYYKLFFSQGKDSVAMAATLDTMQQLSSQLNTDFGRGYYLKSLSFYESRMKRMDNARAINLQAIAEFKKSELTEFLMDAHTEQAYLWRSAGNYEKIFSHAREALEYARKNGNSIETGRSLNTMGIVQRRLGDKDTATRYFLEALDIFTELNHQKYQFSPTINLSNLYSDQEKIDSALHYANLALGVANSQQPPNKNQLVYLHNNLGVLYERQKDYTSALTNSRKALEYIGDSPNDVKALISTTGNVGNNYLQLGRFDEALPYLRRSLALAKRENDLSGMRIRHKQVAQTFAGLGSVDSVVFHFEAFSSLTSRIADSLQFTAVAEMEAKFQNKEKQAEIDRLALEDQIKSLQLKRQSWLISGGLLTLGLLGSFLYFLLQQRLRIRAQNATISTALVEKDTLLKEIHHRVKNNLQMVSSLLSLQSDYVEDDAALDALQMGQRRVRSMAIIHQKLYLRDEVSTAVSARDYLDQLIGELMQTLNVNGIALKLNKQLEDIDLDIDRMIPLGLIANEVITNAMKYAFINRESGKLDINFRRNGATVELTIADDGPGLGEAFSVREDSFGSLLIQTFAEQLEGSVAVDDQAGTRVQLRFPYEAE